MSLLLVKKLRARLHPWRVGLRQARARIRRRLGGGSGDWERALHGDELSFWENALRDSGRNWYPGEFEERTNAQLEVQSFIRELVPAEPGAVVRLLDVGAGPLTRLGKKWEDRFVEILAVDPLAKEYDAILNKLEIVPPVRTTFALAEDLESAFPPDSFDLAYASNALDHCRDPLQAIRQMVRVVKPGSHVYLWHFANVGVAECYTGLHQWNFEIKQGDFVISDGRK
ncbi:MAG TPA: class I SAM-dependent methyltransferase, partial [Methylomirabilota bacterium]|nr:class I SAM-dependent methyltransferase [Methylomirabilota bacterium]